MATSIPTRPLILLLFTALCLLASTSRYGKAYDDHHLGAAGVVADEFIPGAEGEGEGEGGGGGGGAEGEGGGGGGGEEGEGEGEGGAGGGGGEEGEGEGEGGGGGGGGGEEGEGEVESIITKALECFNDKYIYSSCEAEYRLTQRGELHVPSEYADEYCEGACAKETKLVLACVEGIFKHFRFYNKATCGDVRETIEAGCGHGHGHRRGGDFNVAEHVRVDDDEDSATKLSTASLVFVTLLMIMGWNVWF